MNEDINLLQQLYRSVYGNEPLEVLAMPRSGSDRRYYRLLSSDRLNSVVGVVNDNVDENRAFVGLARHFAAVGINVPEVLTVSDDFTAYLQTDLGGMSLFDMIQADGLTSQVESFVERSLQGLADLHYRGSHGLDFSLCYPVESMDRRSVMWDLNYFKYCFLKPSGVDFSEPQLEDDFQRFADMLLSFDCSGFMYRDFQSRNVMICDGKPWFIDFQGGRRGPDLYDVASFLWQARAGFPGEFRERMIARYVDYVSQYQPVDFVEFRRGLNYFVLFRTLQVLGAYGFRGLVEHRAHFLQSIPFAIRNLRELLAYDFPGLDYLKSVLEHLAELPQFAMPTERGELVVEVCSFSYKKGVPLDYSGNGGGFVFDCRAVENPGRYDEYKQLTGLDEPVIEFLDRQDSMRDFLDNVYGLVDASVTTYLRRGFTHLKVCFGCTGGRHRSVYSAQHLAEHLNNKFGVEVVLTHRERGITQYFERL